MLTLALRRAARTPGVDSADALIRPMASATQEMTAEDLRGPDPAVSATGTPRLTGIVVFVLSFALRAGLLAGRLRERRWSASRTCPR